VRLLPALLGRGRALWWTRLEVDEFMRLKIISFLISMIFAGVSFLWGKDSIANSYVNATVGDDFHIKLDTVGGDPNRTTDNKITVLNDKNTYAIVRVEEKLTSDQKTSGVSYNVGKDGKSVYAPAASSPNDIKGEWLIDKEIETGGAKRPIDIDVKQKVTVVRDAIRVEYEVKNGDNQSHNIGFMQLLNIQIPVGSATKTVFWVPNAGKVDSEEVFTGLFVPTYVQAADDFPTSSVATVRATFGDWDATPPHSVLIANADSITGASDVWDYQPLGISVVGNAVLALKWLPTWVSPNSTRKFVFYFGVDWSTNEYVYPIGIGIYAPQTPATSSFTLICDLYNAGDYPISGAQATLTLPDGLGLSQGDTSTKSFPAIMPRASATAADPQAEVSWQIVVSPNAVGHLKLEVKPSVPGFSNLKSIVRYIDIPVGSKRDMSAGISMFSIPFSVADASTGKVLSSLGDVTKRVARWSPKKNGYLYYPNDEEMANIVPGLGYWLKLDNPATLDLSGNNPQPVPWWMDYQIQLDAGWNQIANPFVYEIQWGSVKVQYGGQTKGWSDAVNSGWLRSYIFYWDPTKGSYKWEKDPTFSLKPWEGYFIKTTVPCSFIFSASSVPQPTTSTTAKSFGESLSAQWLIQLSLISGNVKDEANYIGIGKELKVEKPPSPVSTYLNIVRDGESLACDVRSSTAQKVWTIEVNAPQGGEIIWKGMEKLPKGLRLYIIDENGNRTYMGTTSSYKVEGKRILKIEAVEGNRKAMITGLRVVPQRGGVSIAFSLSAEAMVNARITTASGKAVKVLGQRSLKEGANSLYWDGKDERGNPLPAGVYIIEVLARGTDGEFSRAIQMFNLR